MSVIMMMSKCKEVLSKASTTASEKLEAERKSKKKIEQWLATKSFSNKASNKSSRRRKPSTRRKKSQTRGGDGISDSDCDTEEDWEQAELQEHIIMSRLDDQQRVRARLEDIFDPKENAFSADTHIGAVEDIIHRPLYTLWLTLAADNSEEWDQAAGFLTNLGLHLFLFPERLLSRFEATNETSFTKQARDLRRSVCEGQVLRFQQSGQQVLSISFFIANGLEQHMIMKGDSIEYCDQKFECRRTFFTLE